MTTPSAEGDHEMQLKASSSSYLMSYAQQYKEAVVGNEILDLRLPLTMLIKIHLKKR